MIRLSRALLLLTLLCGCPGGNASKPLPAPCTKLGEQCVFEPGKLGACSYRAHCEGPNCLYCQSQH